MWAYPTITEVLHSSRSPVALTGEVQRMLAPVAGRTGRAGYFRGTVGAASFRITRRPFADKISPPEITGFISLAPDGVGSVVRLRFEQPVAAIIGGGAMNLLATTLVIRVGFFGHLQDTKTFFAGVLVPATVVTLLVLVGAFWVDVWLSREKLKMILNMTASSL